MSSKSSEIWGGPPSKAAQDEARRGTWRDVSRSDGRAPIAGTGVLWAIVISLLVVGAILWLAV